MNYTDYLKSKKFISHKMSENKPIREVTLTQPPPQPIFTDTIAINALHAKILLTCKNRTGVNSLLNSLTERLDSLTKDAK